jgi:hypothetical protein
MHSAPAGRGVEGVSVGGGRVSVGIGVSVGWVVLVRIGVLVDSGAAAVQAARVWATAVSTAPGGGAVGDSAQATSTKTKIIPVYILLIDSPFPAPLGGTVATQGFLINTIQDSEVDFKEEILAFL